MSIFTNLVPKTKQMSKSISVGIRTYHRPLTATATTTTTAAAATSNCKKFYLSAKRKEETAQQNCLLSFFEFSLQKLFQLFSKILCEL